MSFIIQVPASTANIGPGFDSLGLALNLYLNVEVELSSAWVVLTDSEELTAFPKDESHFIVQIAIQTALKYETTLHPCILRLSSDIPLARGLGSSAAAIVAGIELADSVGKLNLSHKEKIMLATEFEGHPDNVGASLFGGLVIGRLEEDEVDMLHYNDLNFELVAVIPKETLSTTVSRQVLPEFFSYKQAVQASSTANLLIASLLTGNWDMAGRMMEKDIFHQPYRKELIPNYSMLEKAAKQGGAFGVALSGAGPTVLCFTAKGMSKQLANELNRELPAYEIKQLRIDFAGSRVFGLRAAEQH
ncbi:homoserine kinase [Bacillus sp. EB01]|uniref:homoserine kinase n=1 Tax=Bacillus sp. EB01 TaxID=1347086 RepID=UPI0005C547FE|nr:homoserine kinase [Bacillus sp. EB01]